MNIDPEWMKQQAEIVRQIQRTYGPIIEQMERTYGPMIRRQQEFLKTIEPQLQVAKMLEDFDRLVGPAIREAARIGKLIERDMKLGAMNAAKDFAADMKPALELHGVPDDLFVMPKPSPNPTREEFDEMKSKVEKLEKALIDLQIEIARKLPEVEDED